VVDLYSYLGQTEYVVEFTIGEQPSIGGHQGAARLEHQAETASDPDSPLGCAIAASLDPG